MVTVRAVGNQYHYFRALSAHAQYQPGGCRLMKPMWKKLTGLRNLFCLWGFSPGAWAARWWRCWQRNHLGQSMKLWPPFSRSPPSLPTLSCPPTSLNTAGTSWGAFLWRPARDLRPRSCSHTTLHSLCTELSRPHCMGEGLLRGSAKLGHGPRSWVRPALSVPFCCWGPGPGRAAAASWTGSPQPARPEAPASSAQPGGEGAGTVCEAPRAPPWGLCLDMAISTRPQRVWGTGWTQGSE